MIDERECENESFDEACSLRGTFFRWLTGLFFRLFRKSLMRKGRKYSEISRSGWKAPKGFTLEKFNINGVYAEMLVPDNAADGKVILQLHGGAYITGFNNLYRRNACLYSKMAGNVRVMSVDYRLAPENPYPAALEDTLASYRLLLEQGYSPDKIIFVGDSAGGGLSLAAAMALRDGGKPVPVALVLMSPWADLAAEGKSHKEKYEIDPMFGRKTRGGGISALAYTTRENLKGPYVSPAYGSFDGMPPMLIHVGEYEVLLSDSETVADKARAAGIPVEFKMWRGMFHVFQMYYGFIPEAYRSIKMICRFIKEAFK